MSSKRKAETVENGLEKRVKLDDNTKWLRKPCPRLNPDNDTLTFQQFDVEMILGEPLADMPGSTIGPVPIMRLFGITKEGYSVSCSVHGFTPYFYIPAPSNFQEDDKEAFRKTLNDVVALRGKEEDKSRTHVLGVELTKKMPIQPYQDSFSDFLKIYVALPKNVPTCRNILENGLSFKNQWRQYTTFETNLQYEMRYMIDNGIVGASWVQCPAGDYRLLSKKDTHCQYEVHISYDKLIAFEPEGEWSTSAPFRIFSFDIECAGRKGIFPEAKIDPVIQIATVVQEFGRDAASPVVKNVFVLNSCTPIPGTDVHCFDTEAEMLRAWQEFILKVDPDILTGYNIQNFDLPYLLNRAEHLRVNSFPFFGRVIGSKAVMKNTTFSSSALGTRDTIQTNMPGRVCMDMLQIIQRDYKLRQYSLNSVSYEFLREQKEDVHHSIITDLHNEGPDGRRRLAVYCVKDALLPQRLMEKLMILYNYIEMARVTGVPLDYLLTRGQQIKVISQLYRLTLKKDMVVPFVQSHGSDEKYEGATVLEPKRGFYDKPITTLDFSSLYPSIMIAHNLCYSTHMTPQQAQEMDPETFVRTPTGACFAKATLKQGLLPQILTELLSARKHVKGLLKTEKDPFKKAVLNGRQLALKISANSVYGFTGATTGKLPCLEISSSVTAYGRQMIDHTKNLVEETYSIKNGYAHNAEVVYGDTDSVMIKFGVDNVEESMALGEKAATFVSDTFVKPIRLEFEKVYFPYLLISKKRYAGLFWTNPKKWDKLDCKGIETVRRDNCPLVSGVVSRCLDLLLMERDVQGAINHAKTVVADLLQNKIDISQLVVTKSLAKEEYAAKQPHVELAERMRKRDAGSAPQLGDRVAYVIVQGPKGARAYEKSEDPIFVLENNVPIDTQYYLQQQLTNPLMRIFEPILSNAAQELFAGAHTRTIQMKTSSMGGLARFTVKTEKCLLCKVPLKKGAPQTVCEHCKQREDEAYMREITRSAQLEHTFSRIWAQCQQCQGFLHQDVLCTNRDCPIFYKRVRIRKDLTEQQKVLERFDLSW